MLFPPAVVGEDYVPVRSYETQHDSLVSIAFGLVCMLPKEDTVWPGGVHLGDGRACSASKAGARQVIDWPAGSNGEYLSARERRREESARQEGSSETEFQSAQDQSPVDVTVWVGGSPVTMGIPLGVVAATRLVNTMDKVAPSELGVAIPELKALPGEAFLQGRSAPDHFARLGIVRHS